MKYIWLSDKKLLVQDYIKNVTITQSINFEPISTLGARSLRVVVQVTNIGGTNPTLVCTLRSLITTGTDRYTLLNLGSMTTGITFFQGELNNVPEIVLLTFDLGGTSPSYSILAEFYFFFD